MVAKFIASVVDTGGIFAAGVVDIGGNFSTLTCEYLCECSKKFEMLFTGAWGKVIHEKT